MSDKYRHIKQLPIRYTINSDRSVTVHLNDCLVAAIQEKENVFTVQFINIAFDKIECKDKRECDRYIRERCFDWICVCIDPVHAAATKEVTNQLSFLGITEAQNQVTGTIYDVNN